jgi:ferredoxin
MRAPKTFTARILQVEVVPELCMNFRNCMRIATGAFVPDPQTGKTRPALWQRVDPTLVWRAAWSCPSGAIRLVTERGYLVPRWDEVAHWDSNRHPAAQLTPEQPPDSW